MTCSSRLRPSEDEAPALSRVLASLGASLQFGYLGLCICGRCAGDLELQVQVCAGCARVSAFFSPCLAQVSIVLGSLLAYARISNQSGAVVCVGSRLGFV